MDTSNKTVDWGKVEFNQTATPLQFLQEEGQSAKADLYSEEFAHQMDSKDGLAPFRSEFLIPKKSGLKHAKSNQDANINDEDCVYLCGNSLGLQPKATRRYIEEELSEWELRGVEGHFNHSKNRPWLTTDEYLIDQTCHLVGAQKGEVAIMNSLSVNIHLMMVPFYRPTPERHKIVIEARSFPSDLYIAQSQLNFHNFNHKESLIQLAPREGENNLRLEDILRVIEEQGDQIALILLPGVQYYTGQYFDIKTITEAGHRKGCKVGWDLAHAVGNLDVKLHDWNVDFAAWCTYKYLNSGPGNIAGCFVHSRHAEDPSLKRFAGWWGHDLSTRFNMNEPEFKPIPGAFGFRLSNPPVVCTAALLASLEVFEKAKISVLRKKSLVLTTYLELLINTELQGLGVSIITPTNPSERGCQISLQFQHPELVEKVNNLLLDKGIVCDVRKPNVIRVSPTPLYNTFTDVYRCVHGFKDALVAAQATN